MPIQAPQWTEFLSCPVCYNEFDENVRRPISLGCGHTVCKMCLGQLHRKQCPFDQTEILRDIDELPANYALLQLVGAELGGEEEKLPRSIVDGYLRHYAAAKSCVEDLALYLKPLGKAGLNSTSSSTSTSGCVLSKPMQRKLVALVNCQLVEEEGRSRAMRAARSLGERTVTELILQHQNQQQLSANLWAAVRGRGCQFLGPAMQEETLKLVLLALEDGAALSRKVLVMFVVQKLEQQFPQASKTSVGHVVQLLYRASCFMVTKRDEESSLMQLKDEFRNYDALRREHDAQIVQIAMEAGLRISPEQWSSLLYGDLNHKSHMQSIIDKLQTPASFAASIQELTIALQRSGDPGNLSKLTIHLDHLAAIDPNSDAGVPSWSDLEKAMVAVKTAVQGLVDFIQNHNLSKKALEQQTQNIKYKTSMCRDITQKGGCPRGSNCTFAHSEEELERYRAKSRRMLSAMNRQMSSQNKASERAKSDKLTARGINVRDDGLSKEDCHDLMELQQNVALRNKRDSNLQQRHSGTAAAGAAGGTPLSMMSACDGERDMVPCKAAGSTSGCSEVNVQSTLKSPAQHSTTNMQEHHPLKQQVPYYPAMKASQAVSSKHQVGHVQPSVLYKARRQISHDHQPVPNTHTPTLSSRHVHASDGACQMYSTSQPVDKYQHSNTVTAQSCAVSLLQSNQPVSYTNHKAVGGDKNPNWDVPDGSTQQQHRQDGIQRTVGAGKPVFKPPGVNTWDFIGNTHHKDISLGELWERKQEILHQLRGFSRDENKNPWERSQSLTKTVTSLWTIPTDSITKQKSSSRREDAVYNPWTSQAPFSLIRPVKESNTNYTMTYIKAHVRHMSVDDHHNTIKDRPIGTHELSEFKKMSLEDLEHTLQKVKQEDEQAGSCHYERGHKIQLEMDRRVQQKQQQHTEWERQTDADQCEMMQYYRTLPLGAHHDAIIYQQGHNPMSKSSRTTFKSTGPVQVSAGPSPETNPVTLTQECHVAPSFQSSPSEGYHYLGQQVQDLYSVGGTSESTKWPSQKPASRRSQPGPEETDLERQLKSELADVSQEIQKKVLNKNAQDIVLLEQATHALDPSVPVAAAHNPINVYEPLSDAVIAKQLQEQELEKYKAHCKNQPLQMSP